MWRAALLAALTAGALPAAHGGLVRTRPHARHARDLDAAAKLQGSAANTGALLLDLLRNAQPLPLAVVARPGGAGSDSGASPSPTRRRQRRLADGERHRSWAAAPPGPPPALEGDVPDWIPRAAAVAAASNSSAAAASAGGPRGRRLGTVTQVTAPWAFPASAAVKIVFTLADGVTPVMCSGSLISSFHVLTAGHCAAQSSGAYYPTGGYYVIPGQGDVVAPFTSDGWSRLYTDKPFGLARVRTLTTWGYGSGGATPFSRDYAVLTLDRPIGERAGSFGLFENVANGALFAQRGYPGAGGFKGVWQYLRSGWTVDSLQASGAEAWSDAPICGGDSGSPMLDPSHRVGGVFVGMYWFAGGTPPACSQGGSQSSTVARRLEGAAYDNVAGVLASQTAPAWKAAVYERFKPTGVTDAVGGAAALASYKGIGRVTPPVDATAAGVGTAAVWWSLWNQGGLPSGQIDVSFYATRRPTVVSNTSYTPIDSYSDTAGIAANAFRVYNATVALPVGPPYGTPFTLAAYFTYDGLRYAEDQSARLVFLGTVPHFSPPGWFCPFGTLAGRTGEYVGDTSTPLARRDFLNISCRTTTGGTVRTAATAAGPGQVTLPLDLGLTTAQLGGVLSLSTCDDATAFDTVLYVGRSSAAPGGTCPRAHDQWSCLRYGDTGCPTTSGGTRVTLTVTTTSRLYVTVTGKARGDEGAFKLRWTYNPPSATPSRPPTPSRTRSRSATRKPKRD